MTGKILRFDEVRGYGFIAPDEGREDVFMHANDLVEEKHLYQEGRRVEFFVEEGEKGPKASEIRLVASGAPPAFSRVSRPAVAAPATSRPDDWDTSTVDVLSDADFRGEVTELLINADDTLTAAQIRRVRARLLEAAIARGWVETGED